MNVVQSEISEAEFLHRIDRAEAVGFTFRPQVSPVPIRAWIVRSGGFLTREFASEVHAQTWLAVELARGDVDDWGVGQ